MEEDKKTGGSMYLPVSSLFHSIHSICSSNLAIHNALKVAIINVLNLYLKTNHFLLDIILKHVLESLTLVIVQIV